MESSNTYLTWEQRYNLEQNNKQKEADEKHNIKIKNSFIKQFPDLSFDDLQKQNNIYLTEDGCTHYKHKTTNQIFSWNIVHEIWENNHTLGNESMSLLFEN